MKKLKIRMKNGRIITLDLEQEQDNRYIGTDKFNEKVIINISDIDSLHEIKGSNYDR